ncbi:MAG: nicotinamide-nucleotide amidohydrolase family protein [Propionibacteriaceae bacterium]|nr:nicotinamide-nucleotide amidohydrolase family protein [Propionibacteriaceae bacterium]
MILDEEGLSLARSVVLAASAAGRTLATAESLTGGLLGAMVTSVPGASLIYRGGVITYATDVKGTLGGVPAEVLDLHGAVAAPTAEELAKGAARQCDADVGIALTGVAGPAVQEGQTPGTVWLGWAVKEGRSGAVLLHLSGSRAGIRAAAARCALELALTLVQGEIPLHEPGADVVLDPAEAGVADDTFEVGVADDPSEGGTADDRCRGAAPNVAIDDSVEVAKE